MTSILILAIISILLFGTDKIKEVGRIVLTILVGLSLIGLFLKYSIAIEMFNITNFLLLIVLYIMLFGAERFKEKSKIALLVILGGAVLLYITAIVINAPDNIKAGNWNDIAIQILFLLGSIALAILINSLINRFKKK